MNNMNMAIVMIGFDGYDDLWDDFFDLFFMNWKDCPYPVYLVNNSKEYQHEGVTVYHAGDDAEWSRKVQCALKEIDAKYIMLLLEDLYLGEPVNTKLMEEAVDLMKKDSLIHYKLKSFSKIKTKSYKNKEYLHVIPGNLLYGISLQAAIWERNYLSKKLGTENYNAWKFESDRLAEERHGSPQPLQGCVYDDRNIMNIQHGVVQGQYLPKTVKYFEKKGYHLNMERRQVMRGKKYYLYRLKAMGWPKPLRMILKPIMRAFGMKFVSDENA